MKTPTSQVTVAGSVGPDGVAGPDERIDDPSDEFLTELLGDITSGSLLFLTLDRLDDPDGLTYIQVARTDEDELVVEHRQGSGDHHFEATTSDERLVHEVLVSWRLGSGRWEQALPWRRRDLPATPAPAERKRRWFGL